MKYLLRAESPSRVVLSFSMPERVFAIVFLSVVSLVGLVGGLAFWIASQDPGDAFRALCFGGIGLFCLSAMVLVAGSRLYPSRLVFDNEAGRLSVTGPGGVSTSIPYGGISGFSVCRTVDERMIRHSAGMDLARGGWWELYTPGMVSLLGKLLRIDVSALEPVERIALAEVLRAAVAHDPDPIR